MGRSLHRDTRRGSRRWPLHQDREHRGASRVVRTPSLLGGSAETSNGRAKCRAPHIAATRRKTAGRAPRRRPSLIITVTGSAARRGGDVSTMPQARLVLAPDTSAPSKARELLAEVLDDRSSSDQLSKAQLALSEVVNNAVRHGAADDADRIELEIVHIDDLVRVLVMQPRPMPERPSIVSMPEGWATGGYGLAIIDSIADRWGVHVQPQSVWFEIRLS